MGNSIFTDGGGAGIGSYVVVFKDGRLAENTEFLKLRGAYEAGEAIFFSVIDAETEDALVPASGWIDEERKLHLVARDFDDAKTYSVIITDAPNESEIVAEYAVEDGIEAGGEAIGGVRLEGTSLVIPEQPAPEPVITIDGVAYFHKQEFDLEAMSTGSFFNPINGEAAVRPNPGTVAGDTSIGKVRTYTTVVELWRSPAVNSPKYFQWPYGPTEAYTSRAFTVVDTPEEVTDFTKICLPTCSAYYGFLSEDGKKFISYYNLKSDGAPEYVDSIKQGDAVIPLQDSRLDNLEIKAGQIDSESATAGQALLADGEGGAAWGNLPAGGTKLYKHNVVGIGAGGPASLIFILPYETEITSASIAKTVINDSISILVGGTVIAMPVVEMSFTGNNQAAFSESEITGYYYSSGTLTSFTYQGGDLTDTVTEL